MSTWPMLAARWLAASMCILYGFAKITGAQFTVLDSELARPLGQVSGFWLTWHYFSYSAVYKTIVAALEILTGVLLAFPATALAGGVAALLIASNVVLIDILFGIDLSGTLAAITLWLLGAFIVWPHRRRLLDALSLPQPPGGHSAGTVLAVLLLAGTCFFATDWIAVRNNRLPTAIDGVWAVIADAPEMTPDRPHLVFFEKHRAFLAVFRDTTGVDSRRHFEVDAQGAIRIWDHWLTKTTLLMTGQMVAACEIELRLNGEPREVLRLHRTDCDSSRVSP